MTLLREVPADELAKALRTALMTGPVRALDLVKRMPALFLDRGWPPMADAIAVAGGAVAMKVIGAGGTRFRLPAGVEALGTEWKELHRVAAGAPMPAVGIVEILNLHRLCEHA